MSFCQPDVFFQHLDRLKSCSRIIHNIFLNGHELLELGANPASRFAEFPDSAFALTRKHDQWDDILFAARDLNGLQAGVNSLVEHLISPAKVSIIASEQAGQEMADIFAQAGFRLGRKIARMRNMEDMKELEKKIRENSDGNDDNWDVDFARPGEERQILDLLLTSFDSRADNIPQLEEIRDNILKRQVFVIRDGQKLVACHYFTKNNNMAYGWYDITAREYRKKFLYFHMLKFQYKFWKNEPQIKRSYSWRDCNNRRIMALAKQSSQLPDGVYIYNMIYG